MKDKILVFDNYDSFTYNLVHLLEKILHHKVSVFKNDEISLGDIARYDRIVLSPGPGLPSEAGLLMPLIKEYAAKKSILGVCLGHQAIAEAFGAKLINLRDVYHGVASTLTVVDPDSKLFRGIEPPIEVGRYHSWVVDPGTLPKDFIVTSVDDDGRIMGLRHATLDLHTVQFHPESILTPHGEAMLRNWLFEK